MKSYEYIQEHWDEVLRLGRCMHKARCRMRKLSKSHDEAVACRRLYEAGNGLKAIATTTGLSVTTVFRRIRWDGSMLDDARDEFESARHAFEDFTGISSGDQIPDWFRYCMFAGHMFTGNYHTRHTDVSPDGRTVKKRLLAESGLSNGDGVELDHRIPVSECERVYEDGHFRLITRDGLDWHSERYWRLLPVDRHGRKSSREGSQHITMLHVRNPRMIRYNMEKARSTLRLAKRVHAYSKSNPELAADRISELVGDCTGSYVRRLLAKPISHWGGRVNALQSRYENVTHGCSA